MPQPLLSRDRSISFSFKPRDVLERPLLAPYIAAILMHWNEIESHIGVFLAGLSGAEANTVMKIFLAMNTDSGRRTTIDTIAKIKLSSDQVVEFQKIQEDVGCRYSERNKVVHGAWGTSPSYPDDLLWYDPRESVAAFPDFASLQPIDRLARFQALNKEIRVYKDSDFKDMVARFTATEAALKKFTGPYLEPLFQRMNRWREPNS